MGQLENGEEEMTPQLLDSATSFIAFKIPDPFALRADMARSRCTAEYGLVLERSLVHGMVVEYLPFGVDVLRIQRKLKLLEAQKTIGSFETTFHVKCCSRSGTIYLDAVSEAVPQTVEAILNGLEHKGIPRGSKCPLMRRYIIAQGVDDTSPEGFLDFFQNIVQHNEPVRVQQIELHVRADSGFQVVDQFTLSST